MSELFYLLAVISIITARVMIGKLFNHVSLYFTVFSGMIFFYELRLMSYIELSSFFWLVLYSGSISFLIGSLIYPAYRKYFNNGAAELNEPDHQFYRLLSNEKLLKRIVIFCSIVGFAAAMHHWWVLIDKYGSLPNVLINYNEIYRLRIENKIEGLIPYIYIFGYAGVFFAGILVAKHGKLDFWSLSTLVGIILKDTANAGRAGTLLGFVLFVSTIIICRYGIEHSKQIPVKKFFSRSNVISLTLIIVLFVGSAGIVRSLRGTIESFSESKRELRQFRDNFFLTPSLYLYVSAHIGVLSEYLKDPEGEPAQFGENTFFSFYNILAKFDLADAPVVYDKGYFIPMWTNTATVYKQLYQDFGFTGIFIAPFLTGLLSSFFWVRFFSKFRIYDFLILVFIIVAVWFSFLALVTKVSIWIISLAMISLIIKSVDLYYKFSEEIFRGSNVSPAD